MDVADQKRALRRSIRQRILAMNPADRLAEERQLVDRLPALRGFGNARTVLLYASAFPEEFETRPMLELALGAGKRLICPRVVPAEQRLALFEVADVGRDLVPGLRGIPEPRVGALEVATDEIDWVLVPGLGFDEQCGRIGRGAGHYDRLLAKLRPDAARWALCLTPQWIDRLPLEPHDQPLDGVADCVRVVSRA